MISIDDSELMKKFTGVLEYTQGFLEGVEAGKKNLMKTLGREIVVSLKEYVDSSAKVNPEQLAHMYEWDQVGNDNARLFDIESITNASSIKIVYNFKQSQTIKSGSTQPFYNKAEVMELGQPITISPKKSVLVFEQDGETIFTSKPVVVSDPGGMYARDGFKMTLDQFFNTFSQSFLTMAGIDKYIRELSAYKRNFNSSGRMVGRSVGYKWISDAGVI